MYQDKLPPADVRVRVCLTSVARWAATGGRIHEPFEGYSRRKWVLVARYYHCDWPQ